MVSLRRENFKIKGVTRLLFVLISLSKTQQIPFTAKDTETNGGEPGSQSSLSSRTGYCDFGESKLWLSIDQSPMTLALVLSARRGGGIQEKG